MQWYLISSFIVIVYCLQQYCLAQTTTTVRPYKFGFTIDEQQHRYEKRDERGIVMGEYGFITADGIYHVTVYATDEQGRFRILAMKNYPYESPPKSVEVLVKPKIPVTTTTTEKPVLTRHNFVAEACSGCFLKNGKNKGHNIDGKTEIRTLSQELPESAKSGLPNVPSLTQPKSSIGKNVGPLLVPTFKTNVNTKLNTHEPFKHNIINNKNIFENAKNTQSQINSITPHQQHVMEQIPTSLTAKHLDNKSNIQSLQNPLQIQSNFKDILNRAQTKQTSNTHKQTPTTTVPQQNSAPFGLSNEDAALTTSTNKYSGNTAVKYTQTQTKQNPIKTKNNIRVDNPYLENDFEHKPILNSAQVVHVPTAISGIIETSAIHRHTQTPTTTTVAPENTSPIGHSTEDEELNTTINKYTGNTEVKYTQTQAEPNPKERKNNILVDNPYLENNFKHKDILNSAQTVHVPQIITAGNIGKTAIRHTQTPKTTTTTPVAQQNTTPMVNSNENLALITTTNKKYTGNILIKITPTPMLDKPHTRAVFSEVTNPITKGPQASPGLMSTSKTPTGNNPAIMDIIIGKVLPTLMAKKGIKPATTTTTGNAKPNAPSSKVAGSTTSFNPAASKSSSFNSNTNKGNSNPSAVNGGDGDLYRFKYILDYHGHSETGKRNGNKEGNYFAIGDDNVERTVEYVANENGYQSHIRWRKLNQNESKPKENTLKDYEFVWLTQ